MPDTLYIFLGVPCVSEGTYLFGSFLFYFLSFLSLSLIFLYLQVDLLYASASETNRVGFYRVFITKIREGGGLYSGREGE